MSNIFTPGQHPIGPIAPKLAALTDEILFGDIWQRPGLSPRDRSIVTVAALVSLYRLEQLPFHLEFAKKNGVKQNELVEMITHLAFYAGWPAAHSAVLQLHALSNPSEEE